MALSSNSSWDTGEPKARRNRSWVLTSRSCSFCCAASCTLGARGATSIVSDVVAASAALSLKLLPLLRRAGPAAASSCATRSSTLARLGARSTISRCAAGSCNARQWAALLPAIEQGSQPNWSRGRVSMTWPGGKRSSQHPPTTRERMPDAGPCLAAAGALEFQSVATRF